MKTGLVMEGGAMRGMFTAGVVDVMLDHGIRFDGAIGTSAGAAFGCNYVSGQRGRVIRYNKAYCKNWHYASIRSLLLTGNIFNETFCYHTIPETLDPWDAAAFASSGIPFYVTATDMNTGEAVYHLCHEGTAEDIRWMQASASMPMVSRPIWIEGRPLSDGGTADSIPLRYMESQGYERNVVILTQPRDFVKQPNSALPLMRVALWKYPRLVSALAHRHEGYNETTAYVKAQATAGRVLAIYPEAPLNVPSVCHDPEVLERAYQAGIKVGEAHVEEIKAFIQQGVDIE